MPTFSPQVQKLINHIAEGHQEARFLEVLKILCVLNGKPVRRNQTMIMRLLLEQRNQTLVLFNGPTLPPSTVMIILPPFPSPLLSVSLFMLE